MRLLDPAGAMCANHEPSGSASARGFGTSTSQRATSVPNPSNTGKSLRKAANVASNGAVTSPTTALSALLAPFAAENGKIPSSSRAGADIAEQKTANRPGLFESWKYLPFFAHQATSLASAFVSHHVFGPPKKSWGIELTLFTTAVRESVQYSHLASVDLMRKFLNLGQVLPTPGDGVVTPVVFKVRQRGLPGLLAEADKNEDGTRELTGEWVVSKRIWQRMQREHYGTPKTSAKPTRQARERMQWHTCSGKDKVILYLHGGAYYVMSAATHRFITISTSKHTDCRVFAVNYRLAPECRWPGQIHDAVSAYMRLTDDLKTPPENIIFAGDSAGGGLCLATMLYLRDNGMPLPSGAILMSPWVDLTMSCDSWETNARYDYLRMPSGDDHMNPIASLLGAQNVKKLITHPYVSPLFGDFTGFPPLLIQCGDAECLRDEGTLLAHKASMAGVQVYHEVYEDCPHVFQALFFLEAAKKAFRSHRNFVKRVLPSIKRASRIDLGSMDKEVMSDAHALQNNGEPEAQSLAASPTPEAAKLWASDPAKEDESELDSPHTAMETISDSETTSEEGNASLESKKKDILQPGDTVSSAAQHGLGALVEAASNASASRHHDLDSVQEEQDENVADIDSDEDQDAKSRHSRYYTAASTSETRSTPNSPSTRQRQRSRSTLSLTSLTPTFSTIPLPSPGRPGHSRTPSGGTIRPGYMRMNSRPRARTNSHPDLQALLDSYEASPSQHTVLFTSADNSEDDSGPSDMVIDRAHTPSAHAESKTL